MFEIIIAIIIATIGFGVVVGAVIYTIVSPKCEARRRLNNEKSTLRRIARKKKRLEKKTNRAVKVEYYYNMLKNK